VKQATTGIPASEHPSTQADRVAGRAAERARVDIREPTTLPELEGVVGLFEGIWGPSVGLSLALLRAAALAGSYIACAVRDEAIVGASFGFLAQQDGELHLHSHITGVHPTLQGAGMGLALKLHQRRWALERGIGSVTWTYDPLVRANAYFNLAKLGAEIVAYYPNFYGAMPDAINSGDETDRVLVTWRLESERAVDATEGRLTEPDVTSLLSTNAAAVLDADANDRPGRGDGEGPVLLFRVPRDIVDVRRRDQELAHDWRRALRETMGRALNHGYVATAMTRSGWYVLERKGPAA
jgi:predicted GNAT superfamily acetyltransferase